MKHLFLLLLLTVATTAFSQKQKISVDEDVIMVDGVPYAILERANKPSGDLLLKALDGTELVYLKFEEFNDASKITSGNPKGRVTYYVCTFLNDKQQCEVDANVRKWMAKLIVENKLVEGNAINQESENKLVLISGSKYSEDRKNAGGTTIIINR